MTARAVTRRTRHLLANLVLALAGAAAGTIPATILAALPAQAAGFDSAAAETQLAGQINADRAANGLGPLLVNPALSAVARGATMSVCGQTVHGRSQDMIERNYFSHQVPPCGSQVFPLLTAAGISFSNAGENIGWNNWSPLSTSVDQVNNQFMNSPGHRANILGNYNQVGVGAFAAPGAWSGAGSSLSGVIMYTEIFMTGSAPVAPAPVALGAPSAGDLFGSEMNGTGSNQAEVHALGQASGYLSFVTHAASAFPVTTGDDWRFQVGSLGGDGQPDLFGIHLRGTGSGMVEVHVLSAASGYTGWIMHAATALNALPAGSAVQFTLGSLDGDRRSNLFAILPSGTQSGTVEVHALSERSSYGSWALHSTSAFATVDPSQWQFRIGDASGRGDLVGIAHGSSGSGRTEVHALARSTGYQVFSIHAATPLELTADNQWTFALGDRDHDGVPDLFAIKMNGTGSNRTEVHVVGGAGGYSGWIQHAATALQTTSPASWQFSVR
ncbi:MAG: hypothetical protein M3010_08660 [Candidatus Dormibacteraeota bacterium]|nr:hypothetical protein [Candidatus Dormibacteraeota bacterium]